VESRLEHLVAATSATNRLTTLSAAVDKDGTVTALAWDQLEDCGAYLRAPEPATLYRMHGNMTGAYRVRHLTIHNRVVLTNKTPSGLVRGLSPRDISVVVLPYRPVPLLCEGARLPWYSRKSDRTPSPPDRRTRRNRIGQRLVAIQQMRPWTTQLQQGGSEIS
jgi:hypothetical protein